MHVLYLAGVCFPNKCHWIMVLKIMLNFEFCGLQYFFINSYLYFTTRKACNKHRTLFTKDNQLIQSNGLANENEARKLLYSAK